MIDLKILEEDIFQTLNEKRAVNFLSGARRTTEGMFRFLLDEINFDYGDKLTLGSMMKDKLLRQLSTDINLNSDINYIRLYGNRASHSGNIFAENDIIIVNSSFKRILTFFYSKISKPIPKDIKRFMEKMRVDSNSFDIYSNDKDLYLEALISIESSSKDYPKLGFRLVSNILSKIIIDRYNRVPFELYDQQSGALKTEDAIMFVKKREFIPKNRISELEALHTFFKSSNDLLREENKTPEVANEIIIILRNFSNWFYKIDQTRKRRISRNAISNIVDIVTLSAFGITMFLGVLLFNWNNKLYWHGHDITTPIFILVFLGVSTFILTFLYNLLYPYVLLFQNRKLYSLSRSFTTITGAIGVSILGLFTYWILHDGKPDGGYLTFFIGAILWSVFIQLSLIIKSYTDSNYDKAIRWVSYLLLVVIIGFSIWFSNDYSA